MIRWDPFDDMATLREQMNRLFAQSMSELRHETSCVECWAPPVDILETADAVLVRLELPGIDPAAVDIQLAGDTLTVRGERVQPQIDGARYVRTERAYGPFQRAFAVILPIDQDGVRAAYREGILEITLPKADVAKPKQVRVDVQTEPHAGE
jgi:HSP20 family protein